MPNRPDQLLALSGCALTKIFHRDGGEVVRALDDISLEVQSGTLAALVGPDGAGKTTLLRLAAGLMTVDAGELKVLGIDVSADPQQVQDRIGYMPQKFGLYEDLTVQENIDLYADLHGIDAADRAQRYPRLMGMTALGPFTQRLAGRLSGGMKQKLGLACTLVCAPELLLLDEPTVGVDPLSRRELWAIIFQLVHNEKLTVLLSTSYLDEAERCGHVVVMHHGKALAQGRPSEVSELAAGRVFLAMPPAGCKAREFQARLLDRPDIVDAVPESGRVRFVRGPTDAKMDSMDGLEKPVDQDPGLAGATLSAVAPRFEDGFMVLLQRVSAPRESVGAMTVKLSSNGSHDGAVVQVRELVRQFGAFTAVDHISFEVARGEIFGLLGPNGAGKTTTFRMLCGLLPASSGTLQVAGMDLRRARASARQRIGYVAQKFSLYGQLSVAENLAFFASAYNLRGDRKQERIDWALHQFALTAFTDLPSGNLPGGFKQRLAMAAALMHEPETLFLDEPTSGADPLARREFWRRITALSEQGVTVVVTTHFMEEAEYCDRIAIMDAGKVLAQGTPAEIRSRARADQGKAPTMEDAFAAIVEAARADEAQRSSKQGVA
ncbi:MAG TPA: ATP-binding cassette domain-containing protein [Candidatus Saccharimonadales bacterium]|nr:ATP-binding cassette domain-containing protein [Candidatus Saccharimonadales bacterium]